MNGGVNRRMLSETTTLLTTIVNNFSFKLRPTPGDRRGSSPIDVGDAIRRLSEPMPTAESVPAVAPQVSTTAAALSPVRLGFLPLTDAAPLIAAHELGYFREAGLNVSLERQIGWANVRDKLQYGHLDASHALLGMAVCSAMGAGQGAEPFVAVMSLSRGGNGVTLSRRLVDRGVTSAAMLARWAREARPSERIALAHVFGCSTHHYLLRDWLAGGGVDPDADVRLCVIPPEQMAAHMASGHLDGFCAGEPWNTFASHNGVGSVVAATTDVLPDHPEKVLAVAPGWAARNGGLVTAMIRALLRAAAWCDAPANAAALAEMLADPKYVEVPAEVILKSLRDGPMRAFPRGSFAPPRLFAPEATFPSATHAVWFARQMIRWGHAGAEVDPVAVARACTDSRFYRRAVDELRGSLGVEIRCPADDFPPMALRNGASLDLRNAAASPARPIIRPADQPLSRPFSLNQPSLPAAPLQCAAN